MGIHFVGYPSLFCCYFLGYTPIMLMSGIQHWHSRVCGSMESIALVYVSKPAILGCNSFKHLSENKTN